MDTNIPSPEASPIHDCIDVPKADMEAADSTRSDPKKWLEQGIVLFLVWLVSTCYLSWQVPISPFMGDESGWIHYGVSSAELLLDGNFSGQAWELGSIYGELNLPLGKLLMGVPLLYYARSGDIPLFKGGFDFSQSFDQNMALGNVPSLKLILPARTIMSVYGGLVCVLVFVISRYLRDWVAGMVAVGLLLCNNTFVTVGSQAMTDMPYNLFLLLGLMALLLFLNRATLRGRLGAAVLCGLAGGLATSVKFIGLPLLGYFFVLLLLFCWVLGRDSLRASFAYLTVTATVGMTLAYLLTPNYWPRLHNLNISALAKELHQVALEGKKIPMGDGTEKRFMEVVTDFKFQREEIRTTFPQIGNALLPPAEFFLLPTRWSRLHDYLGSLAKSNDASLSQILYCNFVKYRSFTLETLLLLCSLIYCISIVMCPLREKDIRKELLLLVFFCGYTFFLLLTIKLNEDRFYLPSIILAAMISGIGASALLQNRNEVFALMRQKSDKASPGA